MRTPPPVLPRDPPDSSHYQSTRFDRDGADATLRIKAAGYGAMVGGLVFTALLILGGARSVGALAAFLLFALICGVATSYASARMGDAAGAVFKSFIQPSGTSTPYEQTFSYQEAMIMRGDIGGALASYEAIITEQPGLVSARLRAAEHYIKGNRNPARAAELFRELRDIPGVPTRDAVYSCSRLVDLYYGPLGEPGRAVVELRRIIEQYPGSDSARHARTALPALKELLERERS